MDNLVTAIVLTGGVPLLGLAVSYGVVKARLNNHSKELGRLNGCKAEKDVVKVGFDSVKEKLDLIIELTRNNKPKR